MQEYKLLLKTNLSEGLRAISKLPLIITAPCTSLSVTLETLELLLCLERQARPPSLSLSLYFSFKLCLHLSTLMLLTHRYCFPMPPFISLGEGFDLALASDGFFAKNDRPNPDSSLGMCQSSIGHFLHVNVGTNVKESQVIRHGNVRRKLRGKTVNPTGSIT